jgi:hypothetical protein
VTSGHDGLLCRSPAIVLAFLALLAGQQLAVVAAVKSEQQQDDVSNRKLLATQKANILPFIIKGVVFLGTYVCDTHHIGLPSLQALVIYAMAVLTSGVASPACWNQSAQHHLHA